jgi:hypothetical protein
MYRILLSTSSIIERQVITIPVHNTAGFMFHLDPELTSRDEGAPREGRTRGAVGVPIAIATKTRQKPFSEFKNIGIWSINTAVVHAIRLIKFG